MSLQQQLDNDYQSAFKGGEKEAVAILRLLRSALLNKKIEKHIAKDESLPDDEIIAVIKSEIKKRKDSIEAYKSGNRDDLVAQEESELVMLEKYMPEQMSEEQLVDIVKEIIANTGASSQADFGKVMGGVMAQTKGQADGGLVLKIVKQELSE